MSRSGKPPGLSDDRLALCPKTPNCLCSEHGTEEKAFTSPLQVDTNSHTVMDDVQSIVLEMGGEVISSGPLYLAVTFSSRVFGLVDDFEIRWVPESGLLHIRSASRTGYSDLGVNRKRVKEFKARYNSLLQENL